MQTNRRAFLKAALASSLASPLHALSELPAEAPFKISLAEWSLHRMIQSKQLSNLDFPKFTREQFAIDTVEYVSGLFDTQTPDDAYLKDLKTRCNDEGVTSHLIMIDGEGSVGLATKEGRAQTIEKHKKWLHAAKYLDCKAIRTNVWADGATDDEKAANATLGLQELSDVAKTFGLNVLVENHGGLSSNGAWLAKVIKNTERDNCGTLPDFGNFVIDQEKNEVYDRYQGIEELMPYAKAVSAKSYRFNEQGDEATMDYHRIMKIVLSHGYKGYVGIEFEGEKEVEGIRATQKLLQAIIAETK